MRDLLSLGLAVANLGMLLAQYGRDGTFHPVHLLGPALFTGAFLVAFFAIHGTLHPLRAEKILFSATTVLCGIGLSALLRLDPGLAQRQIVWLIIGLLAFVALSRGSPWSYVPFFRYGWAFMAFVLLLTTALFGIEIGGAKSWLRVGFQFQPVEFVKVFQILFLSAHLPYVLQPHPGGLEVEDEKRNRKNRRRYILSMITITVLFGFALVMQRDLGASLLLLGLSILMVYAATGMIRYVIAGGFGLLVMVAAAATYFDHVRLRLLVWWDPWSLADGAGRQIIESLFALGAGGFFGTGWGRGMASHIPVVETDFIFSLITEELGLLGAGAVLFLLAVICVSIMRPAFQTDLGLTKRLGASGIALLLALQSGLIVAGVTRLLPVTGITLPFVSYGGSSLIASFILLGLGYNLILEGQDHFAPDHTKEVELTWSQV